jgi:2-polyprenyl-6-methoxyphenol hydroxylase-like FAD-dependent oxidoreductase
MASISFPLPQQETPIDVPVNGEDVTTLETPILIIGGGPVGMLLAYILSHRYSQPCTLIETSPTTTIYPKMEFTNGRSMEIYRQLGLVQQLRALGVPEHYTLNELFTTGLADRPGCMTVMRWLRESPEVLKKRDRERNDGTQPVEPYLRCSQIPVEKWLKDLIRKEPLVQSYFGWRFAGLTETENGVSSEIVVSDGSAKRMRIRSQYLAGCDGGGSLVRKEINVKSDRKDL